MALDVGISEGAVEFGGTDTAVVQIRKPSTGASLTITPDTTTQYNVTGFDTQNLYEADGSLKSPDRDRLSINTESGEFTQINVTVSGDREIFTKNAFASYIVAVKTAQGTVIGETEPGLRGIGYPGELSQDATEGTIAVTLSRLSSVDSSWYVEYRASDSDRNTLVSRSATNTDGADNFAVTIDSSRLAEGTYFQDLIIKQNEADPSSQQILRVYGFSSDGLQISDGGSPDEPRDRALQLAGKQDPAELTQDDVTAAITRFSRGQPVNTLTYLRMTLRC